MIWIYDRAIMRHIVILSFFLSSANMFLNARAREVPCLFRGTPLEQIRDFLSERVNEIFDIAKPR